ncbi:Fur family transcriptional regulator [Pseudomaricurvus sp.]|uniref:Fur family transcriptional regulator n=1 Tax=Pseudomaricurvus sp. TaxID=2004510 RepID=UPI003F6BA81E
MTTSKTSATDQTLPTSIASQQHDHTRCIASAMTTAQEVCARNGARLTKLREQVLRLVWQSHKPLGAYPLMDMLAAESTRRVAPPTVYRALEFLLDQGLIHRINTLNAYVGCTHPSHHHANNFLICEHCGVAIEFSASALQEKINETAGDFGFSIKSQSIELVGSCEGCEATHHG